MCHREGGKARRAADKKEKRMEYYMTKGGSGRGRERHGAKKSCERRAQINIYTERGDNSKAIINLPCHISFRY